MSQPHPLPETLERWLAGLRRRGVRCRLQGGGERVSGVRVTGLRSLSPEDRRALVASIPQVRQLLEQRAQRRRPNEKKQQQSKATVQPHGRKVVGQVVNPGGPLRLLFEDECKPIPPRGGRVLSVATYGWRK